MKKPASAADFPCPVEAALDVVGGRWKGVILWRLLQDGTLRFGELRRRLPARLARQTLTNQLRELEADGVVRRETLPEQTPPGVAYSLTAQGQRFGPMLHELCRWGEVHLERAAREVREQHPE